MQPWESQVPGWGPNTPDRWEPDSKIRAATPLARREPPLHADASHPGEATRAILAPCSRCQAEPRQPGQRWCRLPGRETPVTRMGPKQLGETPEVPDKDVHLWDSALA